MKYVLSAIIGALAVLVALLFGKRGLSDNGSGDGRIGASIAGSQITASAITSGISTASGRATNVASSVSVATSGIDKALGILDAIRQRTEADQNGDGTGTGGD